MKKTWEQCVSQKLAEAEEYSRRSDAVRYSQQEFIEKAKAELL